jgi:ribosomal protein S18 acetylase RimI-like enzyme
LFQQSSNKAGAVTILITPAAGGVFSNCCAGPAHSLSDAHSGELLGFGQLCDRFERHHLARLVIRPQHRGNGLAKVLIFELIIQALAQQRRDISLYVHRHNKVAVQCYSRLGFTAGPPPEQENSRLYFMTLTATEAISRANQYLAQI